MSATLIAIVGVIYLAVAVDSYINGNTGMAIAFAGYAFANIGLMMLAK